MIQAEHFPLIVEPSLCLRPVCEDDSNALYACVHANRAHLATWLPWVPLTRSPDDTAAFIRSAQQLRNENTALHCAIYSNNELIGMIGIHALNVTHGWAKLGYWLAQSACGKGIMTKACHRLITYGFDQLHLHRIEIAAATENQASRAIPERLGFTREGTQREVERVNDTYVDHAIYGILRHEWPSARESSASI